MLEVINISTKETIKVRPILSATCLLKPKKMFQCKIAKNRSGTFFLKKHSHGSEKSLEELRGERKCIFIENKVWLSYLNTEKSSPKPPEFPPAALKQEKISQLKREKSKILNSRLPNPSAEP